MVRDFVNGCLDCGLPYEEHGVDVILTAAQWEMIHPGVSGVLCALCLARRVAKLPGRVGVCLRITFADDFEDGSPCGGFFGIMKRLDGLAWSAAAAAWEPTSEPLVICPCPPGRPVSRGIL
jgi:hypothetical protein